MFKWEIMIEDKYLTYVLQMLDGYVLANGAPVPVRNSLVKTVAGKPKVVAKVPGSPNNVTLAINYIKEKGWTEVSKPELVEMAKGIGSTGLNIYNIITRLQSLGAVGPGYKKEGATAKTWPVLNQGQTLLPESQ